MYRNTVFIETDRQFAVIILVFLWNVRKCKEWQKYVLVYIVEKICRAFVNGIQWTQTIILVSPNMWWQFPRLQLPKQEKSDHLFVTKLKFSHKKFYTRRNYIQFLSRQHSMLFPRLSEGCACLWRNDHFCGIINGIFEMKFRNDT